MRRIEIRDFVPELAVRLRRRLGHRSLVPLACIVLPVIATMLFVGVEQRTHKDQFETACDNRSLVIQRRIDSDITLLKALEAYAGASTKNDWASMNRFVAGFTPLSKDVVRYYWWNPAISTAAAQPLEAYPADSAQVIFSPDLIQRLIAESEAKDSPATAILPRQPRVCLIGMAVNHADSGNRTGEGVVLAFNVSDLVEDALSILRPAGIDVSLLDERGMLLHHHSPRDIAHAPRFSRIFQPAPESWMREMPIGLAGIDWTVRYKPADDYLSLFDTAICWGVLIAGLIMAAMVNGAFERRKRQSAAVKELAMLRSRQLAETEGRLEVEIRDKHSAQASLRNSEDRFRRAYEDALIGMVMTDIQGDLTRVNRTMCRFSGYTEKELIGRSIYSLFIEEDRVQAREQSAELLSAALPNYVAVRRVCCKNGDKLWVRSSVTLIEENGRPASFLALLEDLSGEIEARRQLEFQAYHDNLTGLFNRRSFEIALTRAIERARAAGGQVVVMYVDLDGFKFVNDSLGHAIGDLLLPAVATRLTGSLDESATLSRVGGDEFTIILEQTSGSQSVGATATALLEGLHEPFIVDGYELFVSASIGICRYPEDGTDSISMVQHADSAMYQAKRNGKAQFCFFNGEMAAAATARLNMERDLRRALDRSEFEVHFQPLVGSRVPRLVRFEALCRWRHPVSGYVSPCRFIPVAEETGLIVPIGRWVLEEACRQAVEWNRVSASPIRVAVNVSVVQLAQGSFVREVAAALESAGLAPGLLELEITESAVMQNSDGAVRMLDQLRKLGVSIALDDFGTGYSSLSRLRSIPLDVLKIDQSFIRDLAHANGQAELVASIIGLAHGLGLMVVGEGVEHVGQADILTRLGCDTLQGFLFSRPLDGEAARRFVEEADTWSGQESLGVLAAAVEGKPHARYPVGVQAEAPVEVQGD